jgi:hypothetical protein
MANFFTKLLTPAFGGLMTGVADIFDRFTLDKEEKAQFMMEFEKLAQMAESELEETMRAELQAKERILVAELNQGDSYTKRARPTVVYVGLGAIVFNYCLAPLIGWGIQEWSPNYISDLPELILPAEFWYAWGGIVATWSVGRTMERRGSNNNLVRIVTGETNKKPSLFDD